jgi:hypothetical protein
MRTIRSVSCASGILVLVLGAARLAAHEGHECPEGRACPHERPAAGGESARPARSGLSEPTPADIWAGFVEHLKAAGREDLLPAGPDGAVLTPDFKSGDPLLGVLFRLSPELINLHALFDEEGGVAAADRAERARKLIDKVRGHDDPYVREYGEYFAARLALESGEAEEGARGLEKLLQSSRFLPRGEVHRQLALAYRRLGEETLAILELQFYLAGLSREESAHRFWAEEQLKEIRQAHKGPLHDCAERARGISSLISLKQVGEPTQDKQRRVEEILDKVAKLLEDAAKRCPSCEQMTAQKTQCQSSCEKCGACAQGQKQCSACSGLAQGQGRGRRPGDGQGEQGRPESARPNGDPAEESRFPQGEAAQANLRDPSASEKEAWGAINDREVARSLRELWGKIPASYRALVADYFRDITDLTPEPK